MCENHQPNTHKTFTHSTTYISNHRRIFRHAGMNVTRNATKSTQNLVYIIPTIFFMLQNYFKHRLKERRVQSQRKRPTKSNKMKIGHIFTFSSSLASISSPSLSNSCSFSTLFSFYRKNAAVGMCML